jgi:cyclopropane fatty-acyl-phospholipid synthase-like methyltransferase
MAEEVGQTSLPFLQSRILPLVPGLLYRLQEGIAALDLGCGRGRALLQLAQSFPRSTFTGMDLSEEAVAWARSRAAQLGLENVSFEVRDLSDFDVTSPEGEFDLVTTFDAVHDQAKLANLLQGIRRALAPGCVYLAQDIKGSSRHVGYLDNPIVTFLHTISCQHCMTVSPAQGGGGPWSHVGP